MSAVQTTTTAGMESQSEEVDSAIEKKTPTTRKKFIPKPGKITDKSHTLVLIEEMYGREEKSIRNSLRGVVESVWFLYLMGAIILSNVVVMIIEIDRSADQDEDTKSWHWTETCSWISLGIFILELSARMLALQCEFWLDKWNAFDFLIVSIDTAFSLVGLFAQDLFPVSILRIFRLAKLARVSKIFRVFQELRLLIAGLASSLFAIFWGTFLLLVCLVVCSMAAVLFIHPLNKEIDYGDSCSRCPDAYSSVMDTVLTFWTTIVAGDSWGQYTVPLIVEYPQTALFFIPVFLSIGMAVLNLILGVIVSVAQQAKEHIEAEDLREYILVKAESQTHLLGLCLGMDSDRSGGITLAEMLQMFDKPGEFRETLLSLEISREDVEIVWKMIDAHRDGVVPYEDVVDALYEVKSSDSKWMLASIKHYIAVVKEAIQKTVTEEIQQEELILEADKTQIIHKLEEVEALECGGWQKLPDQEVFPHRGELNTPIYPVNLEPNHHVKSAVLSDEEQTWLNQVCHRIATTRSELDGILMDLKCKFEPLASPSTLVLTSVTSIGDSVKKGSSEGRTGNGLTQGSDLDGRIHSLGDELPASVALRLADGRGVEKETVRAANGVFPVSAKCSRFGHL